jgi:tetratricopeptide (TPR) repeat protein
MNRHLAPSLAVLAAACASGAQDGITPAGVEPLEERAVATLAAEGWELLAERRPQEAEALFEEALAREPAHPSARTGRLRAWMDRGLTNDALDGIDVLRREGLEGPELDYLYGMAFARRAATYITQGVTDQAIEMNFADAVEHLERATEAEPDRFDDAYLALATASWYAQDLEGARTAGERAVALAPNDPQAWLQLGRIAMSQFRVAYDGTAWTAEVEAHWALAHAAFERAVERFGRPLGEWTLQAMLSDAALQLGHARMWKEERSRAADAYAIALAWAPDRVDYDVVRRLLLLPEDDASERADGAALNRTFEEASRRFDETFGPEDARDAPLLWWLGWSRLDMGRPADAEAAFRAALEAEPAFVNAWFYIALARRLDGDDAGATAALAAGWDADPTTMVQVLRDEPLAHLPWIEELVGRSLAEGDLAAAATLSELCAETEELEPRHWNNLGFFLREAADELLAAAEEGRAEAPDPAVLTELHERSLAAYERALRLTPGDPQVLNDTAVLLHYYLDRDLARALAMYEEARTLALARLAETQDEEERARLETVVSDTDVNIGLLRALQAERAAIPREHEEDDADPARTRDAEDAQRD